MREPKFIIAIGSKGIGKTYTSKQIIEAYITGSERLKARKTLVFDANNEYPYRRLALKDVLAYANLHKPDVRRVTCFHTDGKRNGYPMTNEELVDSMCHIIQNYSNGLLVLEDITKYIGDSYKKDFIGMLAVLRHVNTDVVVHFQFKGKAGHPKLLAMTNYIRLHETTDSFYAHYDKFGEHLEPLMIAEKLVSYKNSSLPVDKHWFYCYINLERHSIEGNFTKKDLSMAIEEYISDNDNLTIKPLLKKKDRSGQVMYNYNKALQFLEKSYLEKYYGNPN